MKEIELTQEQVALVDDVDYEYLMQWKWYVAWNYNCYRAMRSSSRTNGKRKTIYMHRVIAERMGIVGKCTDHKDHNSLNNQRSNLRGATYSQNLHNRKSQKNNITGIKGVSLHRRTGTYQARIEVKGKRYSLGYFDTITEAAAVVQRKREELVGEFTCH